MIKYQLDIEKFVRNWEVYNSFIRDSLPVTTKFKLYQMSTAVPLISQTLTPHSRLFNNQRYLHYAKENLLFD